MRRLREDYVWLPVRHQCKPAGRREGVLALNCLLPRVDLFHFTK